MTTRFARLVERARIAYACARAHATRPMGRVGSITATLVVLAILGKASGARAIGERGTIDDDASVPIGSEAHNATSVPNAAYVAARPTDDAAVPASASLADGALPCVANATRTVSLNDATLEELERLPGIGPKKAKAIIELRTRSGRFRRLEELRKIRGVGRKMVERLRPLVTVV